MFLAVLKVRRKLVFLQMSIFFGGSHEMSFFRLLGYPYAWETPQMMSHQRTVARDICRMTRRHRNRTFKPATSLHVRAVGQIHPQVQVEFDPDFSFPPRVKPRSLARGSARLLQAKGIKHRHPRRLEILHIARHHRQVKGQRDGSDQVINPLVGGLRAQPPPQR